VPPTRAAASRADAPSPSRSRSRSIPASATPTASSSKAPPRCARPSPLATTQSTPLTGGCSPPSSARVSRTSPSTLSDGSLAFQLQRLAELPLAAVVVEARYSALFKLEHVNGNWLADQLTRLQVRHAGIPIVFADTRRHAEDWTHRFLTTAFTDEAEPN
jgi:hypothetical protein